MLLSRLPKKSRKGLFVLEAKYRFAKKIVAEAGDFLRQHLHDNLEIQVKSHFTDLVTQLDQQVEADLSYKILEVYPDDKILGEEGTSEISVSDGNVWIIDPIDGTTNFIVQQEDFAVLLAYYESGVGKFAILYDVIKDEMIHGGSEFPIRLNDQVLPAFKDKDLKDSLIGLNTGLYAKNVDGLADLANHTLGTRSFGSAGIGFVRVLKGQLLAHASYLFPWDYASASILGEPLGYQLLTTDGGNPSFTGREMVILLPTSKKEEIEALLQ